MQIVLLSGGSGKRLWPLSNDVRSKQFLKLLTDAQGNKQSMVQRVFAQISEAQPHAKITIATNTSQVDSIINQLGSAVDMVIEPERRDTYPAILLACAYLALQKNIAPHETVVVLPVDPFTETDFFRTLTKLEQLVGNDRADLALIGINPLIPTSKYGYIVPKTEISPGAYSVARFVEKPDEQRAQALIEEGAHWNGGVFAFKLGYLMNIAKSAFNFDTFEDLHSSYGTLEKISFDHAVVEKAKNIALVPYAGKWKDIGTWRTLTDEMPHNTLGTALQEKTANTFVVNELSIPVVALGTKDIVVAASPDGILVSDLTKSSHLKPVVDKLEQRTMYEERRWGEYTVLAHDKNNLVKQLFLEEGKFLSYQSHHCRDEVWVVVAGSGRFVLEDEERTVTAGDVLTIKRGQKHCVRAITDLYITEIQLGEKFDENDIERFPYTWKEG